jgi:CRISPR type I-E-associated protein CasB/Cse2
MSASQEQTDPGRKFVERLIELEKRNNRGRLAELRRALSPTTEHQAWPALGALAGPLAFKPNRRLIYQTVGGLFALHPVHEAIGNLGVTCRHLAKGREEAFERRFRRLLACDSLEDLRDQLLRLVKMAKAAAKALDYFELFANMQHFRYDPQRVKVEWAREYWSAPHLEGVGDSTPAPEEETP